MKTMTIGSADVGSLLAGKKTKAYAKLLQKFVSDEHPYWNAKASPIDALRTGAILEDRYGLILPDDYYAQVKATCKDMNVFRCSLDFAQIHKGRVVDFQELKTCSLGDFLEIEPYRNTNNVEFIKRAYKKYYTQVQHQLMCTGLDSAKMVFLAVYSYDDEINQVREIKENEVIKFKIPRDEMVIAKIMQRGTIFQTIKNDYESN